METENTIEKQTSSFKLHKMSKGYNWEIKFYSDDIEELKKKILEMDTWANTNFGGVN